MPSQHSAVSVHNSVQTVPVSSCRYEGTSHLLTWVRVTNAPLVTPQCSVQNQSLLRALGVCLHTGRRASRAVFSLLPGAAVRGVRGGPASACPSARAGACGKGGAN